MKKVLLTLIASLSLSLLLGCSPPDSPLSWTVEEVIEDLRVGMTVAEVEELIGEEPNSELDMSGLISEQLTWRDGNGNSVMVWFFEGYLENFITVIHK